MNDDLKTAVEAMYRLALEGCHTREDCMRVNADVRAFILRLEDVAEDACYDRAFQIEKESERT